MQKEFVLQNEGHSFPFIKIYWHLSYIAVKSFFFPPPATSMVQFVAYSLRFLSHRE